jgi:hypothetical protein
MGHDELTLGKALSAIGRDPERASALLRVLAKRRPARLELARSIPLCRWTVRFVAQPEIWGRVWALRVRPVDVATRAALVLSRTATADPREAMALVAVAVSAASVELLPPMSVGSSRGRARGVLPKPRGASRGGSATDQVLAEVLASLGALEALFDSPVGPEAAFQDDGGGCMLSAEGGDCLVGVEGSCLVAAEGGDCMVAAEGGCVVGAEGGCVVGAEGGCTVAAEGSCLIGAEGGCVASAEGGCFAGAECSMWGAEGLGCGQGQGGCSGEGTCGKGEHCGESGGGGCGEGGGGGCKEGGGGGCGESGCGKRQSGGGQYCGEGPGSGPDDPRKLYWFGPWDCVLGEGGTLASAEIGSDTSFGPWACVVGEGEAFTGAGAGIRGQRYSAHRSYATFGPWTCVLGEGETFAGSEMTTSASALIASVALFLEQLGES